MDPDATIKQLRELAGEVLAWSDGDDAASYDFKAAAVDMAELFQSLDAWIGNGGFLPSRWQNKR